MGSPLASWPWASLGSYKYLLYGPLVAKVVHAWRETGSLPLESWCLHLLLLLVLRSLTFQLWFSYGNMLFFTRRRRVVKDGVDFRQIDAEWDWKTSEVSEVMFRWAQSMLVPEDSNYQGVRSELQRYAPWFDGCIGAIDGTHIPVEVNQAAKADFIDRNGEVSINVCAIVDMHGRFTYVGAGKAGSCHDMAVLRDCEEDPRFPKPPPGRYYLADSGYALREGYITPFLHTRYHSPEFEGVDLRNLNREEKFNYIHAKMRNVIERRFGILKSRWQIVHDGVPFMNREKQSKIIISYFALDNYLWLLKHGAGSKYVVSEWVYMNATASASQLREWISAAVWFT